jgi:hypothetical protein
LSERQSSKIPPIRLTNNKAHTFKPDPVGSSLFIFPQIEIVIGRHQARGISSHPCNIQPKIKKILLATASPSFPPFSLPTFSGETAHPHFVHRIA